MSGTTETVTFILLGLLGALALVEFLFILGVRWFLRQHDIYMFGDDWYPVRIRKYPFANGDVPASRRSQTVHKVEPAATAL